MKPLIIVALSIVCSGNLFAQNVKFTSNDSPKSLTKTAATNLAKDLGETAGFGSVYFQKSDLLELIDVKNCVGIRFYVAMEDPKQRFADVIGVAINSEGKEIGDFLERKYHLAKPLDAHFPDEFKKMNRTTAKKCVDMLKNGTASVEPYTAFLGTSSIKALLQDGNSTGIRIYPSTATIEDNEYRSMSFGSVKTSGKEVIDVSTNYLSSLLPCPVHCGDEKYLW